MGRSSMHATEELCRAIVQMTFSSLSAQVVEVAKQVILDGIAVAVAGSTEAGPRIVAEHVRSLGGKESSSVLGYGFKTSPLFAAYVNGISMHVLDYEPMWKYHPPGIVGVMGSAVAAAHLLALDLNQLQNALGLAASRAGGLMANVGTMTKATHCGWAAAAGLDAALLARRGFTGNAEIFEAANGYAEVFFGESFNFPALMEFGRSYRMVDPGFAIKLFPSQYATHFGITAALELHRTIAAPNDIVSVRITTPIMPYVDRPFPRTGLEGKFSFQYTVAAALLDGAVTVRTFSDERRFRPDMVNLLPSITLVQSDEIPGELEQMWVEITVELQDGQRVTARCNGPKGFWGLARLGREEHLVKIRDCLGMRLGKDATERCIQLVAELDKLGPEGVRELVAIAGC